MAPNGPYLEEQRYISTPSQLSKNLITNASFRAKKLEGDIPRIPGDGEMEGGLVQGGATGKIERSIPGEGWSGTMYW